MLNRKKCVVISEPECRRHSCTEIDLVCSGFFLDPRVRVFKGYRVKVFPCDIAL
jgi:hypothetical protein